MAELEKKLRGYRTPPGLYRDGLFRAKLLELKKALATHQFEGINGIKCFFQKKKYASLRDIINKYPDVFDLDTSSTDLMKKITHLRKTIHKDSIFKL